MKKMIKVENRTNGLSVRVRADNGRITKIQGKRIDEKLGFGKYRAEIELTEFDQHGNGMRVIHQLETIAQLPKS